MLRIINSGPGWRLGWDPNAAEFPGLVGTDDWSLELTRAELDDFCRLLDQLASTLAHMQTELMDEEAIALEAETALIWLEAAGYPHAYRLQMILQTGRRGEGHWAAAAVPALVAAARTLSAERSLS